MLNRDNIQLYSPEEVKLICPFCSTFDTEIERWDNGYPYLRCQKCQVGFYSVQTRAGCNYWNKGVTIEQCKSCVWFNPIIKCPNWVGFLEPPKELKDSLKQSIKLENNRQIS